MTGKRQKFRYLARRRGEYCGFTFMRRRVRKRRRIWRDVGEW